MTTQSLLRPQTPSPDAGLSPANAASPSSPAASPSSPAPSHAEPRVVGLGLLRAPLPLDVPTFVEVSAEHRPRFLFDPLTRRQSILLQEIEAERAEVNQELLVADALRRAEGEALGVNFSTPDTFLASVKVVQESQRDGYLKWQTDSAARYAPLTRKLDDLTCQMLLVWPSALVGDWRAVVGQDVEWAQGQVVWPSLRQDPAAALHARAKMAMDWPQEVMDALKAHVMAATKQGAAGLTKTEAGN